MTGGHSLNSSSAQRTPLSYVTSLSCAVDTACRPFFFFALLCHQSIVVFFFFFLNSYFYPGWHLYGQAGWLPTTQVLKGSLLLNPVVIEKEKKRKSV